MIYRDSFFKKELWQTYKQSSLSTNRQFVFGLFIGLAAIALHLVLMTFTDTVLIDAYPYIMQKSFFTTLYTYNFTSLFLIFIYFLIYYHDLTFEEIRKNCWYLLCKMGYKPVLMIFSKIFALLFSLIAIYTTGFAVTAVLTALLKYTFRLDYIPSLYLMGITDLLVLTFILLTSSLFIKRLNIARYFSVFIYIIQIILKNILGYSALVTNRVAMQNPYNLISFGNSPYLMLCFILVVLCIIVCIFRAKTIAKYYSLPSETYNLYNLPAATKILKLESSTGKLQNLYDPERIQRQNRIAKTATITSIALINIIAVLFNIFVIVISISEPNSNSYTGLMPFLFMSDTMQPEISKNDFVCFKALDNTTSLDVGQIVLFKQDNTVYIERIIGTDGENYIVDIDYYPPISQKGSMVKSVPKSQIFGVYIYKNRWLGALIIIANTLWGRIIFMIIPLLLLFFHNQIYNFLRKMQS